jgi:co-chaperonin GroES (HSP10)
MNLQDLPRLRPTANRLLVHLRPGAQETPGGLIIPPQAQQITQNADVLAIGPDVKHVAVGDLLLLDLHCGTQLCWKQNTPVLMIKETDIQAVL